MSIDDVTSEGTDQTSSVFICLGTREEHFEELKAAEKKGGRFDWWNIKKSARPGDTVVFYLKSPTSAFVAKGTVDSEVHPLKRNQINPLHREGHKKWLGKPVAFIRDAKMLNREVTLERLRKTFPDWGWVQYPRAINAEVPSQYVERFLQLLAIDGSALPKTQVASDLGEPRIQTTTYRILRDTELARKAKVIHNYECQICGHTIMLPNGSRYAEAHHIRPLGKPHNGKDIMGNIICLCPNHHAECDLGAITISHANLRHIEGHVVDPIYVEYHNSEIFGSE